MSVVEDVKNTYEYYRACWLVFYWWPALEALRLRRPEKNLAGDSAFAPSCPESKSPLQAENAETGDPWLTTSMPKLTEEEIAEFRANLFKAARTQYPEEGTGGEYAPEPNFMISPPPPKYRYGQFKA